jgi:hypothetical protein
MALVEALAVDSSRIRLASSWWNCTRRSILRDARSAAKAERKAERGLPAGARRHLYGIAQCGGDVYAHVAARTCRRNPADGDTGTGRAPELLN